QDEALALADLVIVMNEARIEQSGTAREVFGSPRTEFVARFIGGHNVLRFDGRTVAVRMDRLKLAPGSGATATSIEYLGTAVKVGLSSEALGEMSALVPEREFFTDPID